VACEATSSPTKVKQKLSTAQDRNYEALKSSGCYFVLGDHGYLNALKTDEPYTTETHRLARAWNKPTVILVYQLDANEAKELLSYFENFNVLKVASAASEEHVGGTVRLLLAELERYRTKNP